MTVSTEISSNEYTGNGVTTDFDYKFRIFKANQLSVITSDADGDNVVTLRLGTDYTVTGANKSAGGKVILTKPLANGHKISIARDIPITQETSFRNQSKFFAKTHEDAFDYLTMIIQRIWGSLGSLYLKRPNILANWFDAKGYRIANLGKPKRDSDAVDLGTLNDGISSVNSTILKREKRLLRVDDMDIAALPKASDRAGNVLTFDKNGRPIVVVPASGSAADVLNKLAFGDGTLIGLHNGTLKDAIYWVTPEMFGAKGNGIDDDTIPVQMAIDSVNDGTVILKQKYRVTKTNLFAQDFPDGDQPCIYIRDKHGFELSGNGHLIVENHAQGCIEVQRSKHVRINGPKITGAGNFPPIDGMTGLSEKGLPNKGYNTQSFFQAYKNNSYDTSGNVGAGFGGNFPQWGGGVASSWGIWNGGFIGNAGSGILIHNDCDDIEISNCEITGFNFSGVAVGFYGDFFPSNKNYKPSTNIRIHNNKLKGNYNGGVTAMHCDGVTVYDNDVNEIGHPDASWEHENVNPGYGYAALGNDFYPAKGVKVHGNNFIDCKRKGIDAHAGDDHIITDNTVERSYYQGIFYTWSGKKQNATRAAVSGNIISDIKQDGIYIAGLDSDDYSYTNIRLDTVASGNTIKNCDRACIYVLSARDVDVSNNIIKRDKPVTGTHYGIYAGNPFNNTRKLYNVNIKDNIIVAEPDSGFYLGISAELMTEGMVTGNNIRNVGGGGIRVTNGSSENIVTGNMVRVGSDQIGVEVNQTGGRSYPNQVIGGSGINVLNDGRARMTLDTIILYVECNGTSSPTVTRRAGGDNVVSVVSSGTGFTINLQGIGSYVKPVATVSGSSDFLPNDGAGSYAGYMVQRPSTNTQVNIGLKGDGKSPSYMSLASLTAGSFIVRIELM